MEVKTIKCELEAKKVKSPFDDGSSVYQVEGYGSTWDIDLEFDVIAPGAFKNTISRINEGRQPSVKLYYEHRTPIGQFTELREDSKGLYVKGYFHESSNTDIIPKLIADKTIESFSIGGSFSSAKGVDPNNEDDLSFLSEIGVSNFDEQYIEMLDNPDCVSMLKDQCRVVRDVRLKEISLVPYPANPNASLSKKLSNHLKNTSYSDFKEVFNKWYNEREELNFFRTLRGE